jgi:hypothetical protein
LGTEFLFYFFYLFARKKQKGFLFSIIFPIFFLIKKDVITNEKRLFQDFTHGGQPAALDPADILDSKSTGNLNR